MERDWDTLRGRGRGMEKGLLGLHGTVCGSWVTFKGFGCLLWMAMTAHGMPVVHGRCAYSRQNVVN